MLIRSLNKIPFNSQVSQYRQRGLRMSKRIRRDSHSGIILKLLLQKVQPQLEILYDIIIIGTPFIMLHIPSSQNLPILRLQYLPHLLLLTLRLFNVPSLEKTHLTVEKRTMSFLSIVTYCLSYSLTLPKHVLRCRKYLLN